MKVKAIKEELTQLGASTTGLFEKSEFVEALLAARVAAAERQANAEAEPAFDPDVSVGETTKMPRVKMAQFSCEGGFAVRCLGGSPGRRVSAQSTRLVGPRRCSLPTPSSASA